MTVFANLVNGEVQGVYDLLPEVWNGVRLTEENMHENDFVRIVRDNTSFNPETHKMSDFPWYSVEDGQVIEHRDILELPPEPPPEPVQEPQEPTLGETL